jgi:undecaprenyl-diphosphatase
MRRWFVQAVEWIVQPLERLLIWIGKHEPKILLLFLVLLAALLTFVAVADNVAGGNTERFDDWAVKVLRQPDDLAKPRGPPWLWEVGRDMTALGGIAFLSLLTASVAGFLWLRKMYGAMLLVLVATGSGLVVSLLLKHSFHRPRPELVPHLSHVYTSSFPSGHAMLSATVFLTLGALLGRFVHQRVLKAYFLLVAVTLTLLVGLSRVYMGVHYPTDVLAGWTAGLAWALACWLVARALQHRGVIEEGESSGID